MQVSQRPRYAREIWKPNFSSTVYRPRLFVTKTELLKNALQTRGIWKRRLSVFVLKPENI